MAQKGFDDDEYYGQFSTGGGSHKRCFHSHPALSLGTHEGKELVVYGGNCANPAVDDADIYIGLDYSAKTDSVYPWAPAKASSQVFIKYLVPDMGVPADPADFKQMISWIADQIRADKKVHIGCIGGHGRTGTVLSALVKHMMGVEDSTSYVRKNYCTKAVESGTQVSFLKKHFGVKETMGAKAELKGYQGGGGSGGSHKVSATGMVLAGSVAKTPHKGTASAGSTFKPGAKRTVFPITPSEKCVFAINCKKPY